MAGGLLPQFDILNPIGSMLEELSAQIAESATSMFAAVLDWSVSEGASVDWNAAYVLQSYEFAFSLAFFVGLPVILIMHFSTVRSGRSSHSELWDVLLLRLPRWIITSVFGASIGFLLSLLVTKLNGSIVDYMFGESSDEAAKAIEEVMLSTLTGSQVAVFTSVVLGLIIFLSALAMFVSSLLITIASQFLAVMIPLGTLPDLSRRHRGLTRKFLAVYAVVLAAMPLQLFLFGFFFKMVTENLSAGTVPGVVTSELDGGSALANLGLLTVGSLVMLVPLLGPLALLRMVGGQVPSVGGGSGGEGSGTSGAATPQEASMASSGGDTYGPSSGAVLGGSEAAGGAEVAGAAGAGAAGSGAAASGGAAAAGGGAAASGGAATAGTAAAAAGAGAATAGVGAVAVAGLSAAGTAAAAAGAGAATAGVGAVAVAGLSAAGRIAHAVKAETSGKVNQTAQSMSMATMHLDGGGED